MATQEFARVDISDTTAGTEIWASLPSGTYLTAQAIHASSNNTGSVFMSTSSSGKSSGYELVPGQREDWQYDYPDDVPGANDFYIWGGSTGDVITFTATTGRR